MSLSEHRPADLAHVRTSANGRTIEHGLVEHLREVARLAAHHAAPFGGSHWAHMAGQWHDLGKYRDSFQRYIRSASRPDAEVESAHIEGGAGRVSHSTAGALLACERFGAVGLSDRQSSRCTV